MELPVNACLAHGFAMCAHRNQRRKYEDAAYIVHCERVVQLLSEYTSDAEVLAAAFMHDVLEDTDVTEQEMRRIFGDAITDLVLEVTDVSRPQDGNRAARKEKDRQHLAKSSARGATIKLADIIDNCESIANHDPQFAKIYIREAEAILSVIKRGNRDLWQRAHKTLEAARLALGT